MVFKIWLQKEYSDRRRKNTQFTLRSFARLLDMDASSLSQIISGKRNVSTKVINQVCNRLSTAPNIRHKFLQNSSARKKQQTESSFQQISMDSFAVISDWYHFAILELTLTRNFDSSPRWIAKKLGIKSTEVKIAIERLIRLDLLEFHNNTLRRTKSQFTNYSQGITSTAHKEMQRQLLNKALQAIDYVAQDEKDISSIAIPVNLKRLPKAREKIKKFRREMCAFLEKGACDRVYNLGVQLIPLSEITYREEKT